MVLIYVAARYNPIYKNTRTQWRSLHSHVKSGMFRLSWVPMTRIPEDVLCLIISMDGSWEGCDLGNIDLQEAVRRRALEEITAEYWGETGEECILRTMNEHCYPPSINLKRRPPPSIHCNPR
ncbi:hypothetical protein AFLA70_7g006891 [Aspergillus flavus AF70]|nr:hypothetical protein AFLA70_7g006891 [Aspergillus flavus AF70]